MLVIQIHRIEQDKDGKIFGQTTGLCGLEDLGMSLFALIRSKKFENSDEVTLKTATEFIQSLYPVPKSLD